MFLYANFLMKKSKKLKKEKLQNIFANMQKKTYLQIKVKDWNQNAKIAAAGAIF